MDNLFLVVRHKGNVVVSIMFNRAIECYQFVNLTKGHICSCRFASVLDAINDMCSKKDSGEIIDFIEIKG